MPQGIDCARSGLAQQGLELGFWGQARRKLAPGYAPGRLKQWLRALARNYTEAAELFQATRRETDCGALDRMLDVAPGLQLAA